MNIALLIIDMQKIYLNGVSGISSACEHINYVASLLRGKNHLVIHIKDIEGIADATKDEYEIIPEIEQTKTDKTVSKIHSNAFWIWKNY
jgi:nicotinamidase-related amidase